MHTCNCCVKVTKTLVDTIVESIIQTSLEVIPRTEDVLRNGGRLGSGSFQLGGGGI